MRLPGRKSLAAYVVVCATTTFLCSGGAHHDIQVAAIRGFGGAAPSPVGCTSMIISVRAGQLPECPVARAKPGKDACEPLWARGLAVASLAAAEPAEPGGQV